MERRLALIVVFCPHKSALFREFTEKTHRKDAKGAEF
jgi:hypothetical protein